MKFNLIQRKEIDLTKWDRLVESDSKNAIYNLSCYLDCVADNWCILINEQYSGGIAIPYKIKMGIKFCYSPFFISYLDWVGTMPNEWDECLKMLQKEFVQFHLFIRRGFETEKMNLYQTIAIDQISKYSSQATRMINKFNQTEMSLGFTEDPSEILKIIQQVLPKKVNSLSASSFQKLGKLVHQLTTHNLFKFIEVKDKNNIVGGLILSQFNGTIVYLKGAFYSEYKKKGAMYASMHYAIQYAQKEGCLFDFGGSQIDGVRRFNMNLGGIDQLYHTLEWDRAPLWFKLIKKIKNLKH